MIDLKINFTEEEIVNKTERIIKSCKFPSQMKIAYNFIKRLHVTKLISEKYLTYLLVLYEKKASEMESI